MFWPSSNTPVLGGVQWGDVKQAEADHGNWGSDGERSDEPEEDAQQPGVANHQLEYGGNTDGSLDLSDPLLAIIDIVW